MVSFNQTGKSSIGRLHWNDGRKIPAVNAGSELFSIGVTNRIGSLDNEDVENFVELGGSSREMGLVESDFGDKLA